MRRACLRSEWHYQISGFDVCESAFCEVNACSEHTVMNARILAAKPSFNLNYQPTAEVRVRPTPTRRARADRAAFITDRSHDY